MTKRVRISTMVALCAGLSAVLVAQAKTAGPQASVAGTWNMGLQGDHAITTALVLEVDGTTVSGTIALPSPHHELVEVKLTGEFVDRALEVSGVVEHGGQEITVGVSGTLKDDGTLEGTVSLSGHGNLPYTAERSKEHKKRGPSR